MKSQDVLFSQFGNSPLHLSPALTGGFIGDQRAILNFHRQKDDVDHPYLQISTSFETQLRNKSGSFSPWSFGISFDYERAGRASMRLANIGLSSSYKKKLAPTGKSYFSFGLSVGGMSRSYRTGELWESNQFSSKPESSPYLPSDEALGEKREFMESISLGGNLHLQGTHSRTSIDLGGAQFYPSEASHSFSNGVEARLQSRYSLYFLSTIELAPFVDLLLSATGQFQYPHEIFNFSFGGQYHLPHDKVEDWAIQAGMYFRPDLTPIPYAGIRYDAWQLRASYDPTPSDEQELYERIGGPELSLIYFLKKVPQVEFCKTCPTFM